MSGKTFQRLSLSEMVIPGKAGQIAKERVAQLRADFADFMLSQSEPIPAATIINWTPCPDCGQHRCNGNCTEARS